MFTDKERAFISSLIDRYPILIDIESEIGDAYMVMRECYQNGGKLIIAGNGGAAADSEHIVGELMKAFKLPRPLNAAMVQKFKEVDTVRGKILARELENPLPAIALVAHEALSTAYINDVGCNGAFAQQLLGYGKSGDVFLAISSSGNSENIINAAVAAKVLDMKVVGLMGITGGILKNFCDRVVCVPEKETFKVQELHMPIYHCWCMMLEDYFYA
jgi:Phosphoheptose isomerase